MNILRYLIFATVIASSGIVVGEDIKVGQYLFEINPDEITNKSIENNYTEPQTYTEFPGHWFEAHRAFIDGDQNKSFGIEFRRFAENIKINNIIELYDLETLGFNFLGGNACHMVGRGTITNEDGYIAGIWLLTEALTIEKFNNETTITEGFGDPHIFLSYWLDSNEEIILTAKALTCKEFESTVNSIYIKGDKSKIKLIDNFNISC